MKKFLVKEDSCWADEFDLEGFKIIEAETKELVEEILLKGREFPCEIYFGSNECQEYESKEEFLNDISISEISDNDAEVLLRLLGTHFGVTAIL
jgi:hypothetical protein